MLLTEINDELSGILLIPATKVVRKTCSMFFLPKIYFSTYFLSKTPIK
jgi:hypothetical protein